MPALEIYRAPRFLALSLLSQHKAYSNPFPGSGFFAQPVLCSLSLVRTLPLWSWASGSPSMVLGTMASVSPRPGIINESCKPSGSAPDPIVQKLGLAPSTAPVFTGPPGNSDAGSGWTAPVLRKCHFSTPSHAIPRLALASQGHSCSRSCFLAAATTEEAKNLGNSIPGMRGTQF